MLKIHEIGTDAGDLAGVYLRVAVDEARTLELVDTDGAALALPTGALEKVLERYGAPFDPDAPITVVAELELGNGARLRQVQHLAGYDVVPRDYLVLELGHGEPLCCLSAPVAAALRHLARAAARVRASTQ